MSVGFKGHEFHVAFHSVRQATRSALEDLRDRWRGHELAKDGTSQNAGRWGRAYRMGCPQSEGMGERGSREQT